MLKRNKSKNNVEEKRVASRKSKSNHVERRRCVERNNNSDIERKRRNQTSRERGKSSIKQQQ